VRCAFDVIENFRADGQGVFPAELPLDVIGDGPFRREAGLLIRAAPGSICAVLDQHAAEDTCTSFSYWYVGI